MNISKLIIPIIFLMSIAGTYAVNTELTLTPVTPVNRTNYTTGQIVVNLTVSPSGNATFCEFWTGYRMYIRKTKAGKDEMALDHKHKLSPVGSESYHSINSIHSHPFFYHPKGLKDPWNTKGWGTEINPYKEGA